MATKISQYLSHQDAPGILLRFPRLLYPYFLLNYLTVLRMKYARRAINRELRSRPNPKSVIEAGCGMGDFLFTVPQLRNAPQVLGIDVSASNITVCRTLAETEGLQRMNFVCSDLAAAELPKDQDLILCIGVLMYISEDAAVLRNFHRSLAKDGRLLLYAAVNYRRNLKFYKRLSAIRGFDYDEIIGRPQTYTDETLEQKLIDSGFRIERKEHSFGTSAAVMFECSAIFEWIIKSQGPLTAVLVIPFYGLFLPFYFLSMLADFHSTRTTGNGVMITAVKQ